MFLSILAVTQGFLGIILLFGSLRVDRPELLRHRFLLFLFAALGSSSLTSSFVYFNEYIYTRMLLVTLCILSIIALYLVGWSVPRLCKEVKTKLFLG